MVRIRQGIPSAGSIVRIWLSLYVQQAAAPGNGWGCGGLVLACARYAGLQSSDGEHSRPRCLTQVLRPDNGQGAYGCSQYREAPDEPARIAWQDRDCAATTRA